MLLVKYNLLTTRPDLQAVGDEGGGGGRDGGAFYSSCFKGMGVITNVTTNFPIVQK